MIKRLTLFTFIFTMLLTYGCSEESSNLESNSSQVNELSTEVTSNQEEPKKEPKEEKELSTLYSEATKFPIQVLEPTVIPGDPQYNYMNPPMLKVTISNGTNQDIKEIQYGVLSWDENDLPTMPNMYSTFNSNEYVLMFKDPDIRLAVGQSTDSDSGYQLEPEANLSDYSKVVVVIVGYEDFDGNVEINTAALDFLDAAAGKKYNLKNWMNTKV